MELFKLLGTIAINGADKAIADIEDVSDSAEDSTSRFVEGIETVMKWGATLVDAAASGVTALTNMADSAASAGLSFAKLYISFLL